MSRKPELWNPEVPYWLIVVLMIVAGLAWGGLMTLLDRFFG